MRRHLVEGRVGLRLALVWIVGISISSLQFGESDRLLPVVPLGSWLGGALVERLVGRVLDRGTPFRSAR